MTDGRAERFGPYRVVERLGIGGMAVVHRAVEQLADGGEREVALKRLLGHLASDEDFVRAFVREARLASLLEHPNIARIHELGRVGGDYFISMELVSGCDVRQLLKRSHRISTPAPIPVIVSILRDVCSALDYAHTQRDDSGQALGIVHRDVSPSNLLVDQNGVVKVIDFGVAKAGVGQLATRSGRIKGKLGYMAPEALTGAPIDSRSDLFSIGVIAHELICARPLFSGGSDFEIINRVLHGPISAPSIGNTSCPGGLDEIVLRALARSRTERWPTAAAMGQALDWFAERLDPRPSHELVAEWCQRTMSARTPSGRPISVTPTSSSGISQSGLGEPANDDSGPAGPILLDEVPDVSNRVLAPTPTRGDEDAKTLIRVAPVVGDQRALGKRRLPLPAPPPTLVDQSPLPVASDAAPASGQQHEPRITFKTPRGKLRATPWQPAIGEIAGTPTPDVRLVHNLDAGAYNEWAAGTTPPPVSPTDGIAGAPALAPREVRAPRPGHGTSAVVRTSARQWIVGPTGRLVLAGAALLAGIIALAAVLARGGSVPGEQVRFQVEPQAAEIRIDGRPVSSPVELAPGRYRVEIAHDGFETWETSLDVERGHSQTVHIRLAEIESTP